MCFAAATARQSKMGYKMEIGSDGRSLTFFLLLLTNSVVFFNLLNSSKVQFSSISWHIIVWYLTMHEQKIITENFKIGKGNCILGTSI